jgi:hypothetical protein
MIYGFKDDVTTIIDTGDMVKVKPETGEVTVIKKDA